MSRTVTVSTELSAPADVVWSAVKTPTAFRLVTRGLLAMPVIRHRTEAFGQGESVSGVLLLFGLIPISRHRITIETLDDRRRLLRSDEAGGFIRSWRHDIEVEPVDPQRCRYEDRIEIDAGGATAAVTAFARVFYRIRQRRWRQLAPLLAAVAHAEVR